MNRTISFLAIPLAALTLAACGGGNDAGSSGGGAVDVRTSSLGRILVDGDGRTLYLFERDTDGKSTCTGACAETWPPYRTNGKQVTYDGHPLYYFAGDQKPGETNGEGLDEFGGAWYVVAPSGQPVDRS
ncbi:MAG TPA: hypothetical protein VHF89_10760 [Solirubrobacteraceae bacterium]|nr:hypothetical protein [Solirubrobacteraceae bacterium]